MVTNFVSVLFKTQVKAIWINGHNCTFINVMFDSLLQRKKYLKVVAVKAKIITDVFIQSADLFSIISNTLK